MAKKSREQETSEMNATNPEVKCLRFVHFQCLLLVKDHGGSSGSSKLCVSQMVHTPYQDGQVPFPTNLQSCLLCQSAKVPDVLFMTIEPCESLPITGFGTLIQARVCRTKREAKGEICAKEISDVRL